jgi:DNA-binding NarL/FixJ family response regulator
MITAGGARPRVLLADDHTLIVESLAQLLAAEYDIVGTVGDGQTLVTEAERLKPDVVVLDIMMPVMNGLDAARELKRRLPRTRIVCLTMNQDPDVAKEAFRIGVSGFVLKHSAATELMTAIRAVIGGRSYVTPRVTRDLVDASATDPLDTPKRSTITPRQREILQLLAGGHSMKQAAAVLHITPRTVAFHKYQMMAQLRITSTAELIQFAIRQHIVGLLVLLSLGVGGLNPIAFATTMAAQPGAARELYVASSSTAGRRSWPRPGSAGSVAGARL